MADKSPAWFKQATKILTSLDIVTIDKRLKFFEGPRIAFRVRELEGVGFLHGNGREEAFSLCVFEPSERDSSGFVEVFERHMRSLDELPTQIAAWQAFRKNTNVSTMTEAQASYRKIVEKTWRWKQKLATQFLTSGKASFAQRMAAVGIDVDVQALGADWSQASKARLKQDLESIVPELLAWHLPCDDTGQWFLKRRVPLFRYDYDKRRMLDLCLVVVLPDKRSGRARLTTEWLGADSQSVRMDATPEFFDARAIESFQANILRGKGRSANKQALQLWQLQTSGKFADACALVGLAMEDTIEDCLAQKRVSHMCTCCAELDEQLIAWSDLLKQTLLSLNLATLVPLLIRDQARRKQPRS